MNSIDRNFNLGTRDVDWPAALEGRFGRAGRGLVELARQGFERALATFELWTERVHSRRALMRLDDHLLKDIGVNRAEVEAEWQKPFWRA